MVYPTFKIIGLMVEEKIGYGGHLDDVTWTIYANFCFLRHMNIQ